VRSGEGIERLQEDSNVKPPPHQTPKHLQVSREYFQFEKDQRQGLLTSHFFVSSYHSLAIKFRNKYSILQIFGFHPFISITPSKPLMLSGSLLTLQNCETYYLAAVNNDPAITDLKFLPRSRGGRLAANFWARLFNQGHCLPCGLSPQILAEVTIYPGGWREEACC
jgi:hypothetical protein